MLPILYIYFLEVWPSQQATLGNSSTIPYAVLGDCFDHRTRLHSQPRSEIYRLVSALCSKTTNHAQRLVIHSLSRARGTVPTTEHVYIPNHAQGLVDQSLCCARGLVNHFLRCAQGLLRSITDHSSGIALLSYI